MFSNLTNVLADTTRRLPEPWEIERRLISRLVLCCHQSGGLVQEFGAGRILELARGEE